MLIGWNKTLIILLFISPFSLSSNIKYINSIIIKGQTVSSTCNIKIKSLKNNKSVIDFGTLIKTKARTKHTEHLSIQFFDGMSDVLGCSAFYAGGDKVRLEFGTASGDNQLDSNGVIMRTKAGNTLSVELIPDDKNIIPSENITSLNRIVYYPRDFAAKGILNYVASLTTDHNSLLGEYYGSLSLSVTYR